MSKQQPNKQQQQQQTPQFVHAYPVQAGGGGAPVQGYVFTGQVLQQPQYQQPQQYMMQQQQMQQQFMQVPFVLPDASSYLNAPGGREFLAANGWPDGLQNTLIASAVKIPLRYFICDNSGSMSAPDGKRIVGSGNQTKIVGCTRWSELTDSLRFHAMLSEKLGVISDFRLLNGSMPLRLGPHDLVGDNLGTLFREFDKGPNGGTPLCMHIAQIVREVTQIQGQLMANNQKVCVVIATDGESSDGNVVQAMKALERLPVMVVIRLCTDDEKIVQYWNSVDNQVEVEIDVLDDLTGEAEEVNGKNPWLNYGLPMHRLREFGVHLKEIDLLDEHTLSLDQIRTVTSTVLTGPDRSSIDSYPNPEIDMSEFVKKVQQRNPLTWNPRHQRMEPWIDVKKIPGASSCSIM